MCHGETKPVTARTPSSAAVVPISPWVTTRMRRFAVAVGEHTGDGRQQHDRQELQPGGDPEGTGAAGEGEHQPVLGDALHPRADVGDRRNRWRTGGSCGSAGRRTWSSRAGQPVEDRRDARQQVALVGVEAVEVEREPRVASAAIAGEDLAGGVGAARRRPGGRPCRGGGG